ncbi:MAG: HAD family hydrolase [Dongiaceae bacterium]
MAAPAIRAILFDKDGTLFDFHKTWMPGYRAIAAEVAQGDAALTARLLAATGLDPESGELDPASALAAGSNAEIAALWSAVVHHGDAETLTQRLDAWFGAPGAVMPVPVTDLAVLFGRLRDRGLRLGIATMDSHAAALRSVDEYALGVHLDFIAGYDSGHGEKPGPGMVTAFCRSIGIAAPHVAVVGDTPHDMGMARAAGAGLAIGVLTGASPRYGLEALADRVIDSIADLERALGFV